MRRKFAVAALGLAVLFCMTSCRRDTSITPEEVQEQREQEGRAVESTVSSEDWSDAGQTDYSQSGE